MPWKVTDVVDERTRFVLEYDGGSFMMAELCPPRLELRLLGAGELCAPSTLAPRVHSRNEHRNGDVVG